MIKAVFGAGGMALTYLIFLLPLSRPGKNLVLGLVCALAALAVHQIVGRKNALALNKSAPLVVVTVMMLPFLAANILFKIDIATIYIWMMYMMLYIIVNIIWVKKYG